MRAMWRVGEGQVEAGVMARWRVGEGQVEGGRGPGEVG